MPFAGPWTQGLEISHALLETCCKSEKVLYIRGPFCTLHYILHYVVHSLHDGRGIYESRTEGLGKDLTVFTRYPKYDAVGPPKTGLATIFNGQVTWRNLKTNLYSVFSTYAGRIDVSKREFFKHLKWKIVYHKDVSGK